MELFLKRYFSLISPIKTKTKKKTAQKITWLSPIIQALYKIKIQPKMSEKEKNLWFAKRQNQTKTNSEIIGVSLWHQLNPDLNTIDCAIWGVLENKTNATSHPNISSLKTAIKE